MLLNPLVASFWIGGRVGFLDELGGESASLDHEALDHAVEDGAGVETSSTYCRKFSTETGALSLNSSTVMSPSEVEMTTTGLPGRRRRAAPPVRGGRLERRICSEAARQGDQHDRNGRSCRAPGPDHSDRRRCRRSTAEPVLPGSDGSRFARDVRRPSWIQSDGSLRAMTSAQRVLRANRDSCAAVAGTTRLSRPCAHRASAAGEIRDGDRTRERAEGAGGIHPRRLDPRAPVLRQLLRRQGGSCALGAVYEGVYHLPRDHGKLIPDHLERLFRCLDEVTKRCPQGCTSGCRWRR